MAWPRGFIDQVRRDADPLRIIGEVVALKRRGARWVGLCPFHQEKTPSFTVNDEGLWYCFGCGEGGDLLKFVMQYEGADFADAVRSVAERSGIAVPEQERSPGPSDARGSAKVDRPRLMAALAAAQRHYTANLAGAAGEKARRYLTERGFSDEVVERFGLGYALSSWDGVAKALGREGFRPDELEAAGLVKRRGDGSGVYDLLRDRVVFPIRDPRGRPLAFGGRILDEGEPKYLNSPETRVFSKSRTLYGFGEARDGMRRAGFVMLVEGYLDLLACFQHGFENVVAPLGTAFTADHAKLLSRQVGKAVIAFDGDAAGQAAAERTVGTFLAAGFHVSVMPLPAGSDPDDFLAEHGRDGLREALRKGLPALSFLVSRVAERGDVRTPQGKTQALASLLGFVLEIDDRVERAEWIGRIAGALDIREDLVERSFADLRARGRPGGVRSPERSEAPTVASPHLDTVPLAERDLLRTVLRKPDWLPRLRETHGQGAIRDARVEALLEAVEKWVEEHPGDRLDPADLVGRSEVAGADQLLSRLAVEESGEPDWEYARGCALGIRRDALRRQVAAVQRQIEEALRAGRDVADLEQRKMALAQELRGGGG